MGIGRGEQMRIGSWIAFQQRIPGAPSADDFDGAAGWVPEHDLLGEAKALREDQLQGFDVEYVCEREWKLVEPAFDARFRDRAFSFLDVGGGNGQFADRLLDRYPRANGTVLDSARVLLEQNVSHPRKQLVLGSAEHLTRLFRERFDLIVFNWALHHFVASTYSGTRRLQRDVLRQARALLAPAGVVSIFENLYNGFLLDGLPGRMIFHATSSAAFAPVARRLGANTAGCGVCFLSRREWEEEAFCAGLQVSSYVQGFPKTLHPLTKAALSVRSVHHGHFFLTRG